MSSYEPIAISAEMNKYGRWVVTISVAPGRRMQVMLALPYATPASAIAAIMSLPPSAYPAGV